MKLEYERGDKVIYIPEAKIYDFGYYSATDGLVIIYEEGECNMQDSFAVKVDNIKPMKRYDK